MNRAIASTLAAAALTLAIALPALAAPPFVLVDIVVTCESDGVPVDVRIPEAPPGQARQAIAEGFRTIECDPGTRELIFGTRPVTFASICAGLGGIVDDSGFCVFMDVKWSEFRQALSAFGSHCRGQIVWIWGTDGLGESKVKCSVLPEA
jgi:hypothetical protein